MAKIAIYERVSTSQQDTDAQHHAILLWLGKHRPGVEFVLYTDELSGKSEKRPGYQAMLRAIRAGEIHTVVVYRLDRLSRNAAAAMTVLIEWMQAGLDFYAVDQPILQLGKENPFRLTFCSLMSELAQIERETIVARVKSGLAAARARGVRLGGVPKVTEAQRETARRMRAEGATFKAVARHLELSVATVHKIARDA